MQKLIHRRSRRKSR